MNFRQCFALFASFIMLMTPVTAAVGQLEGKLQEDVMLKWDYNDQTATSEGWSYFNLYISELNTLYKGANGRVMPPPPAYGAIPALPLRSVCTEETTGNPLWDACRQTCTNTFNSAMNTCITNLQACQGDCQDDFSVCMSQCATLPADQQEGCRFTCNTDEDVCLQGCQTNPSYANCVQTAQTNLGTCFNTCRNQYGEPMGTGNVNCSFVVSHGSGEGRYNFQEDKRYYFYLSAVDQSMNEGPLTAPSSSLQYTLTKTPAPITFNCSLSSYPNYLHGCNTQMNTVYDDDEWVFKWQKPKACRNTATDIVTILSDPTATCPAGSTKEDYAYPAGTKFRVYESLSPISRNAIAENRGVTKLVELADAYEYIYMAHKDGTFRYYAVTAEEPVDVVYSDPTSAATKLVRGSDDTTAPQFKIDPKLNATLKQREDSILLMWNMGKDECTDPDYQAYDIYRADGVTNIAVLDGIRTIAELESAASPDNGNLKPIGKRVKGNCSNTTNTVLIHYDIATHEPIMVENEIYKYVIVPVDAVSNEGDPSPAGAKSNEVRYVPFKPGTPVVKTKWRMNASLTPPYEVTDGWNESANGTGCGSGDNYAAQCEIGLTNETAMKNVKFRIERAKWSTDNNVPFGYFKIYKSMGVPIDIHSPSTYSSVREWREQLDAKNATNYTEQATMGTGTYYYAVTEVDNKGHGSEAVMFYDVYGKVFRPDDTLEDYTRFATDDPPFEVIRYGGDGGNWGSGSACRVGGPGGQNPDETTVLCDAEQLGKLVLSGASALLAPGSTEAGPYLYRAVVLGNDRLGLTKMNSIYAASGSDIKGDVTGVIGISGTAGEKVDVYRNVLVFPTEGMTCGKAYLVLEKKYKTVPAPGAAEGMGMVVPYAEARFITPEQMGLSASESITWCKEADHAYLLGLLNFNKNTREVGDIYSYKAKFNALTANNPLTFEPKFMDALITQTNNAPGQLLGSGAGSTTLVNGTSDMVVLEYRDCPMATGYGCPVPVKPAGYADWKTPGTDPRAVDATGYLSVTTEGGAKKIILGLAWDPTSFRASSFDQLGQAGEAKLATYRYCTIANVIKYLTKNSYKDKLTWSGGANTGIAMFNPAKDLDPSVASCGLGTDYTMPQFAAQVRGKEAEGSQHRIANALRDFYVSAAPGASYADAEVMIYLKGATIAGGIASADFSEFSKIAMCEVRGPDVYCPTIDSCEWETEALIDAAVEGKPIQLKTFRGDGIKYVTVTCTGKNGQSAEVRPSIVLQSTGLELTTTLDSETTDFDSDNDGYMDYDEMGLTTSPTNVADMFDKDKTPLKDTSEAATATINDTDTDGLSNALEAELRTRASTGFSDSSDDTDGDGMTDKQELFAGLPAGDSNNRYPIDWANSPTWRDIGAKLFTKILKFDVTYPLIVNEEAGVHSTKVRKGNRVVLQNNAPIQLHSGAVTAGHLSVTITDQNTTNGWTYQKYTDSNKLPLEAIQRLEQRATTVCSNTVPTHITLTLSGILLTSANIPSGAISAAGALSWITVGPKQGNDYTDSNVSDVTLTSSVLNTVRIEPYMSLIEWTCSDATSSAMYVGIPEFSVLGSASAPAPITITGAYLDGVTIPAANVEAVETEVALQRISITGNTNGNLDLSYNYGTADTTKITTSTPSLGVHDGYVSEKMSCHTGVTRPDNRAYFNPLQTWQTCTITGAEWANGEVTAHVLCYVPALYDVGVPYQVELSCSDPLSNERLMKTLEITHMDLLKPQITITGSFTEAVDPNKATVIGKYAEDFSVDGRVVVQSQTGPTMVTYGGVTASSGVPQIEVQVTDKDGLMPAACAISNMQDPGSVFSHAYMTANDNNLPLWCWSEPTWAQCAVPSAIAPIYNVGVDAAGQFVLRASSTTTVPTGTTLTPMQVTVVRREFYNGSQSATGVFSYALMTDKDHPDVMYKCASGAASCPGTELVPVTPSEVRADELCTPTDASQTPLQARTFTCPIKHYLVEEEGAHTLTITCADQGGSNNTKNVYIARDLTPPMMVEKIGDKGLIKDAPMKFVWMPGGCAVNRDLPSDHRLDVTDLNLWYGIGYEPSYYKVTETDNKMYETATIIALDGGITYYTKDTSGAYSAAVLPRYYRLESGAYTEATEINTIAGTGYYTTTDDTSFMTATLPEYYTLTNPVTAMIDAQLSSLGWDAVREVRWTANASGFYGKKALKDPTSGNVVCVSSSTGGVEQLWTAMGTNTVTISGTTAIVAGTKFREYEEMDIPVPLLKTPYSTHIFGQARDVSICKKGMSPLSKPDGNRECAEYGGAVTDKGARDAGSGVGKIIVKEIKLLKDSTEFDVNADMGSVRISGTYVVGTTTEPGTSSIGMAADGIRTDWVPLTPPDGAQKYDTEGAYYAIQIYAVDRVGNEGSPLTIYVEYRDVGSRMCGAPSTRHGVDKVTGAPGEGDSDTNCCFDKFKSGTGNQKDVLDLWFVWALQGGAETFNNRCIQFGELGAMHQAAMIKLAGAFESAKHVAYKDYHPLDDREDDITESIGTGVSPDAIPTKDTAQVINTYVGGVAYSLLAPLMYRRSLNTPGGWIRPGALMPISTAKLVTTEAFTVGNVGGQALLDAGVKGADASKTYSVTVRKGSGVKADTAVDFNVGDKVVGTQEGLTVTKGEKIEFTESGAPTNTNPTVGKVTNKDGLGVTTTGPVQVKPSIGARMTRFYAKYGTYVMIVLMAFSVVFNLIAESTDMPPGVRNTVNFITMTLMVAVPLAFTASALSTGAMTARAGAANIGALVVMLIIQIVMECSPGWDTDSEKLCVDKSWTERECKSLSACEWDSKCSVKGNLCT